MKKLTVCLMLAAFAMVTSSQAGEKSGKSQATSADSAKATCSSAAQASCADKTACCAKVTAKVRQTMRGANLLARL